MKAGLAACVLGLMTIQAGADNAAPGPKNGTVLIIRHAERKVPEDKSDPTLTPVGNGVFGWLVVLDFGPDGTLKASKVINEKLEPDDTVPPASP